MSPEPPNPAKDLVRGFLRAVDARDLESIHAFVTDDIEFVTATEPPVQGRSEYASTCRAFFASVRSVRHRVDRLISLPSDPNVVIATMAVRYERVDGTAVNLPVVCAYRMRDHLIARYEIRTDIRTALTLGDG